MPPPDSSSLPFPDPFSLPLLPPSSPLVAHQPEGEAVRNDDDVQVGPTDVPIREVPVEVIQYIYHIDMIQ